MCFARVKLLQLQRELHAYITHRARRCEKRLGTVSQDFTETRDIYRCRVRRKVIPRVTGIRFPGAGGPCRGTGPFFTSHSFL